MKTWLLVTVMGLIGSGHIVATGQEKDAFPVGVFESRDQANQFFGELKQLQDPEINAILPTMYDVVMGQPLGTTPSKLAGGDGMMPWLSNPKLRKELDLVDSQFEDLKQVQEQFRKRLQAEMNSADLSNPKALAAMIREVQTQSERELKDLLLPHQVDRIQQLSAQTQLGRKTLAEIITSEPHRSDLKITERQAEDLIAAEAEIEAELAEEIARLQTRAREKFLSRLDAEQREKVERLFGEVWEAKKRRRSK